MVLHLRLRGELGSIKYCALNKRLFFLQTVIPASAANRLSSSIALLCARGDLFSLVGTKADPPRRKCNVRNNWPFRGAERDSVRGAALSCKHRALERAYLARATFKPVFLYYITDRKQLSPNENDAHRLLLDRVRMAAAAGLDAIQIRERDLSARELTELGKRAVELVRETNPSTKLLINSRSDVAIACEADGVHLHSDDISAAEARAIFMQAGILQQTIAVSCHTPEEVELAEGHGADFAVFGPVFEKDREARERGISALRAVCNRRAGMPPMPVFALGGVNAENALKCLQAGAAGIAGIRLFQNGNVEQVVSTLRKLVA